ncbi:CBS domain protein [uncultured Desulfobacterium sp.]|uniref:CBS domain protein n=1 Tax=uncultured Desulfobacterium sp. TaxID=201089 RepID=A0A445MQP1_9BACT|nr:CBS domain protein [uncultured Desulfobacterium sp.]
MTKNSKIKKYNAGIPLDISEEDIMEAMKDIKGYIDITPGDFKELYRLGYRHAIERLSKFFKAGDVMTREVYSITRETSTEEIAQVMASKGVTGLPVIDNENRVIGIVTETDFLSQLGSKDAKSFMDIIAQCLRSKGCVALPLRKQKAQDIMTSPVVTVTEDTAVTQVAAIMTEKGINRVPVTDRQGRLIGIVSRADIVQVSCELATKTGD